MDLKILSDFFKDYNLNFLGFEIDSSVIRYYKNRFSNDPSTTNLNQWQIYEEENPNTFRGMYQFWIQKNSIYLIRGFKYEVQHGLEIHETPDAGF